MKISFILPGAYVPYIKLVIESVIKQVAPPYEVIVSEDGDSSEMRSMLQKYIGKTPFILKHVSTPKNGFRASMVRNKGVAVSSGDMLIFSDGDLLLHPLFFADFASVSAKGKAFIGTRSFIKESKTKELLKKGILPDKFKLSWLEKNTINAFHIPFLAQLYKPYTDTPHLRGGLISVHRDDYFALNGYDERFEGWGREDADFVVRLFYHGVTIRKLKFRGLTRHLWHKIEKRGQLSQNEELYKETIHNPIIYCKNGLDKYL